MEQDMRPVDPRNEDDFDTWQYGTEPLPNDKTWCSPKLDKLEDSNQQSPG